MEGSYSRRTLGHLNRKRVESVEKPITPSDELSSWLGDDVCAHCSGPAKGGQLYCSKQCRESDEQDHNSKTATVAGASHSEATPSTSQRPPSPVSEADGKQNQPSSSSLEDRSFRYPCPPSPNLLAQYQTSNVNSASTVSATTTTTSALTSPALTAFQRSLPQQQSRGRPVQFSNPASSDRSYYQPQRRSSSQSTFSSNSASASENAYTTDPSTTSPNAGGAVSDEESESSELNLPPSAASASLVLLKSNGGTLRSTSASSSNSAAVAQPSSSSNPSPSSSNSATASGPTSIKSPVATFNGSGSSMKFARRPSSTNVQPPVLYSPALAPTSTSKIYAARAQISSTSSSSSTSSKVTASRSYDVERKLGMGGLAGQRKQLRDMRRHSDDAAEGGNDTDVKALDVTPITPFDKKTSFMVRGQAGTPSERSPPLNSLASSTTKTIHALSPEESSQGHAVCGRYGCRGSSTRRESIGELASSLRSNSNLGSRSATSPIPSSGSISPQSLSSSRGRSRPSRHQHTHSATAGLGELPRLTASAIKALTMTPVLDARRTVISPSPKAIQQRGRSPARRNSPGSGHGKGMEASAVDAVAEPSRGRSKARGPRSTSRRSESPSRVLKSHRLRSGSPARGGRVNVSSELPLQQTQDRSRSDSETSNPPSPLSPKSHPISITRSGRLGPSSGRTRPQEGGASPGGIADDEKELGGISPLALKAHKAIGRSSSRGRRENHGSGDEARGRDSKVRTSAVSSERGRSREQLGHGIKKSKEKILVEDLNLNEVKEDADPGFDDVDDIEL